MLVNVEHCKFFRLSFGNSVNDVETKVERIFVGERNFFKRALVVKNGIDKLLPNSIVVGNALFNMYVEVR